MIQFNPNKVPIYITLHVIKLNFCSSNVFSLYKF